MPARIPNAEMIKALLMAAGVGGADITIDEYDRLARINGWPSVSAIKKRFGGWGKSKEAAGLIENESFCEDCMEIGTCEIEDMKKCHYYDESSLYFEPVDI